MRPLTKLYVEVTTQCNLECRMCVRQVWDAPLEHMPLPTFDLLLEQLDEFAVWPILHLGGYGEPMFHPDFLEMVYRAKRTGAQVEVTTNGTLLDADMATALVELELDRLIVSVDSVTPEAYRDLRGDNCFSQVVENLRHLYRLKLRGKGRHSFPIVGLAFVAMKSNIQDLSQLPRLATKVGAWEILVSNLLPHSPAMREEVLYQKSLTACAYRESRWVANLSLPKIDLSAQTVEPLRQVFNSTASLGLADVSLSARNDYCRFVWEGYAALRWDGETSPCLNLLHNHPVYVLDRRRDLLSYSVGNIHRQSLCSIWQASDFASFRSKVQDFPFSPCTTCGGCERFASNLIDCSDNTFPVCGGCLWAQGFIQCP